MTGPNTIGRTIGREEIRAALSARGGDLRAVGELFDLTTQQVLMILAYDVSMTSLASGGKTNPAQSVMDSISAAIPASPSPKDRPSRA